MGLSLMVMEQFAVPPLVSGPYVGTQRLYKPCLFAAYASKLSCQHDTLSTKARNTDGSNHEVSHPYTHQEDRLESCFLLPNRVLVWVSFPS
jgi:hypothetical protein